MMCGKVLLCLEGQLCGLQRPLPTYLTSPLDGGQWSCYVRLGTFARMCTVLMLGVQHSMSVRSRPHPFRTHTHTLQVLAQEAQLVTPAAVVCFPNYEPHLHPTVPTTTTYLGSQSGKDSAKSLCTLSLPPSVSEA